MAGELQGSGGNAGATHQTGSDARWQTPAATCADGFRAPIYRSGMGTPRSTWHGRETDPTPASGG